MNTTRRTVAAALGALVILPALAIPASAHTPGVGAGPVVAGCSDASVQPVRRNARGQVVEQYVLRATLTTRTTHTHLVDRRLRISNAHTGALSAWRTVQRNRAVACGKGTGTSAISGTTNLAGVAWKMRTGVTLPQPALDNGAAQGVVPQPHEPIILAGVAWK